MRTFKHKGKEYEVVDIYFIEGVATSSLNLIGVISDGGVMDIVEFRGDFYKNFNEVDVCLKQQYMTKRTAKILFEC